MSTYRYDRCDRNLNSIWVIKFMFFMMSLFPPVMLITYNLFLRLDLVCDSLSYITEKLSATKYSYKYYTKSQYMASFIIIYFCKIPVTPTSVS